jgi:hypothetical protein
MRWFETFMVAVPHTNIAVTPPNGPRLSQSLRALNYGVPGATIMNSTKVAPPVLPC